MTAGPVAFRPIAGGLVAALLAVGGCGGGDDRSGSTLTVLAASSLTDVFGVLERRYESRHPNVDVQLSFDSSRTLAEQVVQGAPADVLATADRATMRVVVGEGLGSRPVVFARNELVLVTPPDDPGNVDRITDLDDGDVAYAVCVPEAPCGTASAVLLERSGVTAAPVTEEDSVRDTLGKVVAGEVDAGIVFVSDAQAVGRRVRVIPVAAGDNVRTPDLAVVLDDPDPDTDTETAQAWVDLLTSAAGQRALLDHGFLPAPAAAERSP
ncbi:MAG TPA: molybdate ABC transporter substrate-binding protein [Nocardioidaceae bacterium]|nr:molybdate ABC transporter substrate-binding protein [Nocardioidaceae bacterium]